MPTTQRRKADAHRHHQEQQHQQQDSLTTKPVNIIFGNGKGGLDSELISDIFSSYLELSDILQLRLVSRRLLALASSDLVWKNLLIDLWNGKVHTNAYFVAKAAWDQYDNVTNHRCNIMQSQMSGSTSSDTSSIRSSSQSNSPTTLPSKCFQAYVFSKQDAQRQQITKEELTRFRWRFRTKESGGEQLLSWDPWWQDPDPNDPPHLRAAKTDARVCRFLDDGQIIEEMERYEHLSIDNVDPRFYLSRLFSRTWKFILGSMDFADQPVGSYISMTLQNRYLPTFVVRRCHREYNNWGFIVENCWCVFMSFPMPPRGQCPVLEDNALLVQNSDQWRESYIFNHVTGGISSRDHHNVDEFKVEAFDRSLNVDNRRRYVLVHRHYSEQNEYMMLPYVEIESSSSDPSSNSTYNFNN